jgi:UDP-sugar transporter A1/2/3
MPDQNTLLKFLSLGLLVPHTIIYTLLAAVARKPDAQGHVFFGPSAVAIMELGKMMISIIGVMHFKATTPDHVAPGVQADGGQKISDGARGEYIAIPERNPSLTEVPIDGEESDQEPRRRDMTYRDIFNGAREEILNPNGLRLITPALLYVCQNNLQVFSAGCLTPAEYQIVGQTKLAFTAVFSVLILKRKLNWQHWGSIATLALGTIIVQTISVREVRKDIAAAAAAAEPVSSTLSASSNGAPVRTQWELLIGTAAMLGASACSGLGGVLVEALLKKKMHFWTTNVHLAFFSLLPATVPIFADTVMHGTFAPLRFFTYVVWCLIAFNILGGIIASMVR